MAPHRRRVPPEQVPDEAPKEVPPQGEAAPAGGYDQFADALWASFQQRFVQQYQEQPARPRQLKLVVVVQDHGQKGS